ncbi:hypothetical protein P280DRAFT_467564 [Massarina eburnea CBS 473.64]|uniref:50S ribosomal protein-like protein YmL27 n=1 Tax=Massarina eburnea CBS 473.64 TaxID=1395130 RepID=A0A6A6S8M7_9PLEO|nr:hypothetical protein P280DRAFT_467564 [Massarina eburnea CBS 473.64]
MFKPTPRLQKMLRRLPLSTKQAGKEYYKGNRIGSMGTIDNYGRFHPDYSKIRTFVYPVKGTRNFDLTPFVSANFTRNIEGAKSTYQIPAKSLSGEEYLRDWKEQGGHDDVGGIQSPGAETSAVSTPSLLGSGTKTNMPEVWEERGGRV